MAANTPKTTTFFWPLRKPWCVYPVSTLKTIDRASAILSTGTARRRAEGSLSHEYKSSHRLDDEC
ncbi:MAG: hypothetical protein AAFV29_00580, partial [Myxococcota bacterium]